MMSLSCRMIACLQSNSGLVPLLLDPQAPCLLYWTLRPCAFLRQLPDKTREFYHFVRKRRGYRRPRQKPSDFVSAGREHRDRDAALQHRQHGRVFNHGLISTTHRHEQPYCRSKIHLYALLLPHVNINRISTIISLARVHYCCVYTVERYKYGCVPITPTSTTLSPLLPPAFYDPNIRGYSTRIRIEFH